MSASTAGRASGEPLLAWIERGTAKRRQDDADFDDSSLEFRRLFSEVWGTFLLVLVAAGGGVVGALPVGADLTLAMKALAPGMMVMGIIFFMGTISGAHLNPAVTLAFAVRGNFPWIRVPGYIIAQIVGGILAAVFLNMAYGGILNGATEPGQGISDGTAVLTEAILTLGLVSVILGTASGAQNIGIFGAIGVGGYIALAGLWGSPISGASMNPARTFGPDLVGRDFGSYWVYVAGPITGAIIAVGFAYVLRGAGGGRAGSAAAQGELSTDVKRPRQA
jgi:aquaporin Z